MFGTEELSFELWTWPPDAIGGGRYAANIGVLLLNKYLLSYYGFKYVPKASST